MVEVEGAGGEVARGVVGQGGDGEDEGRVGEGPGEEEEHGGGGEGLCGEEGGVRGFEVVDADGGDGVFVGGGVGDETGGRVGGEGGHFSRYWIEWGEREKGGGGSVERRKGVGDGLWCWGR